MDVLGLQEGGRKVGQIAALLRSCQQPTSAGSKILFDFHFMLQLLQMLQPSQNALPQLAF
jgi:hypothetical protein